MKQKYRGVLAACGLCLFLLAGCTNQQTMEGVTSSNNESMPPAEDMINGIQIYPMGQYQTDASKLFSYEIMSAEVFPTLAAAGLKAADLYLGSNYMSLNGESQEIKLDGENLPQGFAVLYLQGEARAEKEASAQDITPQVNVMTLTTKASLEGTEDQSFEPVYNSKAPEENRETAYFHLPHLEKGESESFETAFLVPEDLMTDGNLYITLYETNGVTTRAVALTLDESGEAS